jgi:hypothetical protein
MRSTPPRQQLAKAGARPAEQVRPVKPQILPLLEFR